jgi:hypothetical protein
MFLRVAVSSVVDPIMNPIIGNPASNFDEAWKEVLDAYFQEFMEFFYPDLAQFIDWTKGYEFMDKELQALTTDGLIGKKYVDKLVKIYSHTGQAGMVLLHTEIQGVRKRISRKGCLFITIDCKIVTNYPY